DLAERIAKGVVLIGTARSGNASAGLQVAVSLLCRRKIAGLDSADQRLESLIEGRTRWRRGSRILQPLREFACRYAAAAIGIKLGEQSVGLIGAQPGSAFGTGEFGLADGIVAVAVDLVK